MFTKFDRKFASCGSPILSSWLQISMLKELHRAGWLRQGRGVPAEVCESVAEHSFGLVVLALLVLPSVPELDAQKVIMMSVFHDIGEVKAGDITPFDGISLEEKIEAENECIQSVFGALPGGGEYIELWDEYAVGETAEAEFVHQLDKVEMLLQARIYKKQFGMPDDDFYESVSAAVMHPVLLAIIDECRN